MSQIILAISGRKGAGKNTIAKSISRYYVTSTFLFQAPSYGEDDINVYVAKYVGEYSFADPLKEFCINVLGLEYCQCYGTDEEKNSPTQYRWEDVPDLYLRWKFAGQQWEDTQKESVTTREQFWKVYIEGFCDYGFRHSIPILKTGHMSGRDIMQLLGTDLIRETFGNVWARASINKIRADNKPLAILTDNRFPNEIKAILDAGGYILRLTRSPYGVDDMHPSEASLDNYDWNKTGCFVLDNEHMTIEEQTNAVLPILDKILS